MHSTDKFSDPFFAQKVVWFFYNLSEMVSSMGLNLLTDFPLSSIQTYTELTRLSVIFLSPEFFPNGMLFHCPYNLLVFFCSGKAPISHFCFILFLSSQTLLPLYLPDSFSIFKFQIKCNILK